MNLQPFESENLVFIDTEFSSLDPYKGELLSVGMVKMSGEELYVELTFDGDVHPWVSEHVLPLLTKTKLSREDAARAIKEFLGDAMPFAVAFVDNYDVMYLTKLFGAGNLPFRWLTIDIASILFAHGVNPVKFQQDNSGAKSFYRKLGLKPYQYRQHHALDDARLLRDVWQKLVNQ